MKPEKHITSIKEDIVLEARSIQACAGRELAKKCLLEGEEEILWALDSPCTVMHVFAHEKQKDHPFVKQLNAENIPLYFTSDGILKKITGTNYLVPFVGVASIPPQEAKLKQEFVVLLDGVQDFGNLGTIVRTAAAFGIREFISSDPSRDFFYKKTIDASRGTVFFSRLKRFRSGKEAASFLKSQGFQIAVTTPHASVIQTFAPLEQKPIAIVLGNETEGVSKEVEELADIKIQIPMSGAIESLNVGVAAGISLYEMKIKWIMTMLTNKIQESLGRHLYAASKWVRLVFDKKLKEATPFTADQAIMMMILKSDGKADAESLAHDAGLSPSADSDALLSPLIERGFVQKLGQTLTLSEKGEEAIAKIWSIHELTEEIVFKGVTEDEKLSFLKTIETLYQNCEGIVPFS